MINILFKNPYVLLAGGACLITSTSFWFFERSRANQPTKSASPQADTPANTGANAQDKAQSNPSSGGSHVSTPTNNQGGQSTNSNPTPGQTGKTNNIDVTQINVTVGGGSSANPSDVANRINT